jgi:hypothetical protein
LWIEVSSSGVSAGALAAQRDSAGGGAMGPFEREILFERVCA